ncbi:hypothetical protein [Pediococcus pentosaceus]
MTNANETLFNHELARNCAVIISDPELNDNEKLKAIGTLLTQLDSYYS